MIIKKIKIWYYKRKIKKLTKDIREFEVIYKAAYKIGMDPEYRDRNENEFGLDLYKEVIKNMYYQTVVKRNKIKTKLGEIDE